MTDAADRISIRPVGPDEWRAFSRLFEARGSPKNCWCMAWRGTAAERSAISQVTGTKDDSSRARWSDLRREAMRTRIAASIPVGLLAFDGDEPIGWCSIAPRPTYRNLGGPKDHIDQPEKVWSIACFFITKPWRGRGLTSDFVEATPVEPDSPSYRCMGIRPVFAAAGFRPVAQAGHRRTVMRLATEPKAAEF